MFPGLGGLNPKKMQGLMKQMGINQSEIDAEKVTIEKTDGSKIVIQPANVTKITMQGQETFQVAGNVREETGLSYNEEDIKQVIEKTSCSEQEAKSALEKTNGDLAEAILELN